jgi:hypothetical protein
MFKIYKLRIQTYVKTFSFSLFRNFAVNIRIGQKMEYSSVPEKMTLLGVQMGKCMATCAPCVKLSCEYRVLRCQRKEETL